MSRPICLALALATASLAGPPTAHAQLEPSKDAPRDEIALSRHWFQDAKLGLFIHWGVFSLLRKGEWVMDREKIPISEYAKLPPRFNPTRFDPQAWVKLARSAGARYITITAKNFDGFCMFASQLTDYDVVDATPLGSDPLKSLADACRQEKIKLFIYYSLLDWHHPDYFPGGKTGATTGRPTHRNPERYVAYYQGQIRELCSNYGTIGGFSFDGWWDNPDADWDLAGTYRLIHELQPGALIGNNHHVAPFPGEDLQMCDQDHPGENGPGLNRTAVADILPRETCLTINDSRGYNMRDARFKSAEQLVHALLGAAGRGANLNLSVGPRPDGTIGPEFADRLLEIGKWLSAFGESVYGTRRGPISPQTWGVSTAKGTPEHPDSIYLHIFKSKEGMSIAFDPTFSWTPRLFGRKEPLKMRRTKQSLLLDLPRDPAMPIDTIIALSPKASDR